MWNSRYLFYRNNSGIQKYQTHSTNLTLSRYNTFIFVQAGIVQEARILDDVEMLRKIGNTESSLEFVCKEVVYHNSCRKKYSYDARASLKKKESQSQTNRLKLREITEKAFETTVQFVQSHVLEKREVHRVSDISNQYRMLLCEHELDYDNAARHRRYLFLEKLNSHFGEKLKTVNHPSKGVGIIIFSSEMSTEQAISTSFDMSFSAEIKV